MAYLIKPFAEVKPNDPALIDEMGTTSWDEFNRRTNRLIHRLREIGLETGDVFSVLSGNRREYFEAYTASLHGGWLLVPINWHLVPEEVAYMLADSGSKALIVDERLSDLAEASVVHPEAAKLQAVVTMGTSGSDFEAYEDFIAIASDAEPEGQGIGATMFYTSGTTGKPKGVLSAQSQIGVPIETLRPADQEVVPEVGTTLLIGPVYHTAQQVFSFLPLLSGKAVVMRHRFDAAETLALIDEYGITNTHMVPTQFVRMLRLDQETKDTFDGSSLNVIWHGAAPCAPDVKRQMIDWWGPIFTEYYGSTEGSLVTVVESEDWLKKPGTVGKATPSCEVIIIGDDGEPVEALGTGQIYVKNLVGSDFKYHNDPKKTEKVHLGPGVFTFGDMGYLDEDGYLFLSDRKIDMIISGGVNIYPAEIEAVLLNHDAVMDAAVFGIPNEEFGEEVRAALELRSDLLPDDALEGDLVTHCRKHLAGYKVPRSFDFLSQLPRTPTGKLLKRLLREPYWEGQNRMV